MFTADINERLTVMTEERTPIITLLSDVEPQEVSWLWPGRLALGKYHVLMGLPDTGKTTIALDLAARLSVGRAWPDGAACHQGRSLILTAEDGIADTIRPRIDKLGGDPSQIGVLEGVRDKNGRGPLNLERDLDQLEKAIEQFKPVMVGIDPFSAYLGDTNSHRDSAVRGLLNPLKDVLERHNVALLAVAHTHKNANQELMHRMGGSIGLIAAARMAMVVGKHPHDPDRRVLAMFKSNLSARARSLDYMVADGAVTWDANAPDIAPEELMNTPSSEEKSVVDEAEEFLSEYLNRGPAKTTDVKRAARANGVTQMTLRRAKKRLNVQTRKVGFGLNSYTEWSLSSETPKWLNVSGEQLCENTGKKESTEI